MYPGALIVRDGALNLPGIFPAGACVSYPGVIEMKKESGRAYGFWIVLTEAVGALSGWLSRKGVRIYTSELQKPPFSPPRLVFPIVWSALFLLMGIGAARIYQAPKTKERTCALVLFFLQLAFNFFWSILFFNFQAFGLAFLWLLALWVLILLMISWFRRVDQAAAWMQLPYLLWVSFAAYLNLGAWFLNR